MVALPTGYGKSLPMLLLGLLMPEGGSAVFAPQEVFIPSPLIGSTTYIVPPLTTIEAQLLSECDRLGIPAVAGSQAIIVLFYAWKIWCLYSKIVHNLLINNSLQIFPEDFGAAMARRPKIVIANVEFLAHREV